MKTKKRLPILKRKGELKISKAGKRCHFMGSLRDKDQRNDETWTWLEGEKLKRETVAAQDQALRTNYVKTKIDRSQEDPRCTCRMCKQNNETISPIVTGCPKLAQKEYKKRHDNLGQFTGTCKKNVGLSKVRGGMNMSQTVYLKIRITRCCGT